MDNRTLVDLGGHTSWRSDDRWKEFNNQKTVKKWLQYKNFNSSSDDIVIVTEAHPEIDCHNSVTFTGETTGTYDMSILCHRMTGAVPVSLRIEEILRCKALNTTTSFIISSSGGY